MPPIPPHLQSNLTIERRKKRLLIVTESVFLEKYRSVADLSCVDGCSLFLLCEVLPGSGTAARRSDVTGHCASSRGVCEQR
jgi:hypothetical protein